MYKVMSIITISSILFFTILFYGGNHITEHHSKKSPDCGCLHRKNCAMPCVNCCGPEGMNDCFKNPDPNGH